MKIGLWGTPSTDEGWEQVWTLMKQLEEEEPSVYGGAALSDAFFRHRREARSPTSVTALSTIDREHLPLISDLLVVWGGREALLDLLEPIVRHGPTVLLVGEKQQFPAIREERLADALGQVLSGEGTLDSRMLLGVRQSDSGQERSRADNDRCADADVRSHKAGQVGAEEVVFQRSKRDTLLRIDLSVNGRPLTSYEADGLVVSTPTGSAARSLSAGGPLVVPGTEGLLLTPVASHTLTARPLLVPASSRIEARVQSRSGEVCFRVDQSTCPLESGDVITIRRTRDDLQLAHPNGEPVHRFRGRGKEPLAGPSRPTAAGSSPPVDPKLATDAPTDSLWKGASAPRGRMPRKRTLGKRLFQGRRSQDCGPSRNRF